MMMTGVPGSGKSTARDAIVEKFGSLVSYVSSDEIREKINGDAAIQDNAKLVWDTFYAEANSRNEQVVILDATFLTPKVRRDAMKRLDKNRELLAYPLVVDLEVAKKRNKGRDRVVPEHVIECMFENYVIPTKDEGFVEVFDDHPRELNL